MERKGAGVGIERKGESKMDSGIRRKGWTELTGCVTEGGPSPSYVPDYASSEHEKSNS